MEDQETIRVAIADDHAVTRSGLKTYIQKSEDIIVSHEAQDGQQMLTILAATPVLPDVCLIDVHMPVMDGVALLQAIRSKWPSIKCLAITADDYHPLVLRMIRFGVNGYLQKNVTPQELIRAIVMVHKIGYYYSALAGIDTFQKVLSNKVPVRELDREELAFLKYCCSDMSYEAIARAMNMKFDSLNNLRKKLFRKFDVTSRPGLAIAAVAEALVPEVLPKN